MGSKVVAWGRDTVIADLKGNQMSPCILKKEVVHVSTVKECNYKPA